MKRKQFLKSLILAPFLAAFPALALALKPKIQAARKPKIKSLGFIKHRNLIIKARQVGGMYCLHPWQIMSLPENRGKRIVVRYDGGEWENYSNHNPNYVGVPRKMSMAQTAELGVYESEKLIDPRYFETGNWRKDPVMARIVRENLTQK